MTTISVEQHSSRRRKRHRSLPIAVGAAIGTGILSVALAALGSSPGYASSTSSSDTNAATTSLKGVTLVVGDQNKLTQTIMQAAGVLKNVPYTISWSEFPAAAQLLVALNTGAIDVGIGGDASIVTAYANGDNIRAVAAGKITGPTWEGIVVPANSPIKTIADLKGKTISPSASGSISQYFLAEVLAKAGLNVSQVNLAPLAPPAALAALESGSIQAWAGASPYLQLALAQGFHILANSNANGYVSEETYLSANANALKERQLAAAIADFRNRYEKAFEWANTHKAKYAPIYSQATGLPLSVANAILTGEGQTQFVPLKGTLPHLQQIAHVFHGLGVIQTNPSMSLFLDNGLK
jgi:sulfonate transport system substrate-binding protein